MKINDAVFGSLFLVLALAMLIGAQNLPKFPGQAYGPSLYPTVIGLVLAPVSIGLIVSGLRRWWSAPVIEFADWVRTPRKLASFFIVVTSVLFYILISDVLGFIVTSILILTCLFGWLWRRPWTSVALAVIVTMVIHVFFYSFLLVPLPWGVLESVSW